MNAIVDNHEAPMVVSSVMKQNCTERGRRLVEQGMDIAAGAAICRGDRNFIANGYMSLPIAITVEGANIMTRSFQIIGQGLTRCHPYMLELIQTLQMPESQEKEAIQRFNKQIYNILGHTFATFGTSLTRSLTSTATTAFRSNTAYKSGSSMVDYHEQQLLRLTSNFAFTANLCFCLGGRLKFEELLMGRLADSLGAIFLGYAVLHHYSRNKNIEGLDALVEHSMLRLEREAQEALLDASNNFPGPLAFALRPIMKLGCFPLGSITRPYNNPSDDLTKEVSRLLSTPSAVRDMFQENVYTAPDSEKHHATELVKALPIVVEADRITKAMRSEKRQATAAEQGILDQAEALRDALIQVDVFPKGLTAEEQADGYIRPAILGTQERLAKEERTSFAA